MPESWSLCLVLGPCSGPGSYATCGSSFTSRKSGAKTWSLDAAALFAVTHFGSQRTFVSLMCTAENKDLSLSAAT